MCEIVRSDQDCDEGCCWQYYCAHDKLVDVDGNHLDDLESMGAPS